MKKGHYIGAVLAGSLFCILFMTGFIKGPKETCIEFETVQSSSLYKDCKNMVTYTGEVDNFEISNAFPVINKDDKTLEIGPISPTVTVSAKKDGAIVKSKTYYVKLPPKPIIDISLPSGESPDQLNGEKAGSLRSIKLKAYTNDEFFKTNFPTDARYFVSQWEVMLVRGKRPVNKRTVRGSSFNISTLGQQRPGDRILLDVKSVVRKNYKGRVLPVQFDRTIYNIPLNEE